MYRVSIRPPLIALAAALAAGGAAQARPPIVAKWPIVASDRQGGCELSIRSNGRIMWIEVEGLIPGSRARFGVTNLRMKPIDWNVLADSSGTWSTAYLPMLWSEHYGAHFATVRQSESTGTVAVKVDAPGCELAVSSGWRREIRVIP
jgi:hypothetical protein